MADRARARSLRAGAPVSVGRARRAGPPASVVEIGALRLSLPGPDAAFGRRVAERVGVRLAERCPPGLTGDIGALSVKVHAGALTEEGLGDSIVEALLGALGRF
jgi:hypothetical protein